LARIAAVRQSNPTNRMAKHFDPAYFATLSDAEKKGLLQCCRSGIENPDSSMGCYAMQPADYDRFKPFFSNVLADYHGVDVSTVHVNDWSLAGVAGLPEDGLLDLAKLGLPALSMRVRVGRNLADFPLPGAMSKEQRVAMELKMCEAFAKLVALPEYGGRYHSLTEGHADHISEAEYQALVDEHIMFKDMAADPYLSTAGIASAWVSE
jgi:creatine kinase